MQRKEDLVAQGLSLKFQARLNVCPGAQGQGSHISSWDSSRALCEVSFTLPYKVSLFLETFELHRTQFYLGLYQAPFPHIDPQETQVEMSLSEL